jgi:hypothetical protein
MSNPASPIEDGTTKKWDIRKQFKHLYNPPAGKMALVDVPDWQFLMIDGMGNPNTSQDYQDAVQALYRVSYTLKFQIKKEQAADYQVMPLEGLWWASDMQAFTIADKDRWQWTMMNMQPDLVTPAMFASARDLAARKETLAALSQLRLERFHEGAAAQVMYIGPYANEGPTIAALHAFIHDQGYALTGKHHEIYLGDPRRAAPEKLKTVIRQPIQMEDQG